MLNRKLNVLILSSFASGNAKVIEDYLQAFDQHSKHCFYYSTASTSYAPLKSALRLVNRFDAIIFFWSLYLPNNIFSPEEESMIRNASAVKILFLQDEYRHVRWFNQKMNDLGINVMLTCVAQDNHEYFYPPSKIPSLKATYTVLTGFVPDYLADLIPDFDSPRRLDIVYRSRSVPFYLGDLGQEKVEIASKFKTIAAQYNWRVDISVREEDRIYGDAWIRFLQSSRFTLGTGSGASIIDLDGQFRKCNEDYIKLHPSATYADVRQACFSTANWCGPVIDTISPRAFEAAACGTIMILHEGNYGGILKKNVHYIEIKKDYSNLEDVIGKMNDLVFCQKLAQNAYNDLIKSGTYSYKNFIVWFDQLLNQHCVTGVRKSPPALINFYLKQYLLNNQNYFPIKNKLSYFKNFYPPTFSSISWLLVNLVTNTKLYGYVRQTVIFQKFRGLILFKMKK